MSHHQLWGCDIFLEYGKMSPQDHCFSPLDMVSAFVISLCLMQDLVHNVLIPVQAH